MFDEEPDGDPHGECRAEIHRLTALRCDCDEESGRHAPTCVVMVREQNVAMAAEIARLTAELAAARAVPADVEAAIEATNYAMDRDEAADKLRAAIARAISDATDKRDAEWQKRIAPLHPNRTGDGCDSGDPIDWTFAALMLARIDVESDAHDEGHRAAMRDATAARGTVGGLLATAPVGSIVECSFMRSHRQVRATGFESIEQRWYADGAWSDWYSLSYQFIAFQLPARLVPAAEADASPESRGPLPKGG